MAAAGNAPHKFKLHRFDRPTWCDFCTKFIWGVGVKQGYKCKLCDYATHKRCHTLVPSTCTQAAPVQQAGEKRDIARQSFTSATDLTAAMQAANSGLVIKDRKVKLKSYPASFTGKDAVDWMLGHLPMRDRQEAHDLLERLRAAKFISHASGKQKPFKDTDSSLYKFNDGVMVAPGEDPLQLQDMDATAAKVGPDDFEELQVIGRGGFGQVLKVKKKGDATDKVYAMKVMNKNKISGERQLQCLIAEKNIMLNDNPFLVHLHFSFQSADQLFFVMDYIPGGDLAFHLEQRQQFNEKEVRFLTAEIALALEHLHSCGIIYRDLKLENILIDGGGHVCLTDFGLSKELDSVDASTKTVCGTPTYLAPEILLGQPYTTLIDWWSVGVVMYELFTGMNPFDAADFQAVLTNILQSTIILPDAIPKEARELMEALLQRDPAKRMCAGPTGSQEIQQHPFFKSIDWEDMMVKRVKSPIKIDLKEDYFDPSLNDNPEAPPEGRGASDQDIGDFTYVPGLKN